MLKLACNPFRWSFRNYYIKGCVDSNSLLWGPRSNGCIRWFLTIIWKPTDLICFKHGVYMSWRTVEQCQGSIWIWATLVSIATQLQTRNSWDLMDWRSLCRNWKGNFLQTWFLTVSAFLQKKCHSEPHCRHLSGQKLLKFGVSDHSLEIHQPSHFRLVYKPTAPFYNDCHFKLSAFTPCWVVLTMMPCLHWTITTVDLNSDELVNTGEICISV